MSQDVRKRLNEIAEAIKAGAEPNQFDKELDRLLNTEIPPRDHEAEAKWENDYRKQVEDV